MNIENTPTIETMRLRLRKFEERDIPFLYRIYSDVAVNTYLPWYPLKSEEETKQFFEERYCRVYLQARGYQYAICLKEQDEPIGYIKIDISDAYDFGYVLLNEYQHQGIMTEAGEALLTLVKHDGVPFITATHDVHNSASGNVMKRLGMTYCYSYEEQWLPKDFPVTFRLYQINFDDQQDRVFQTYWNQSSVHFIENDV